MAEYINDYAQSAFSAFERYKLISGAERASFLEKIAENIENLGDELLNTATEESHLPFARFVGERGRTCNQLRMFAALLREGSWVEASIDTALPDRLPAAKPDLRKMLIPLGPVAVFGASNFPLAFSTAGGDTASALAAGCTVVYKEHPAHPRTSKLVANAIEKAIHDCQMPEGTFVHFSGNIEAAQDLVRHPLIRAVAFTGSYLGGKSIFDIANRREVPIPVFAEMGSVNPIFIFPEKLRNEREALAKQLAASVNLGVGQFCTNPGLCFVPSNQAVAFREHLKTAFESLVSSKMLHSGIAENYRIKLREQLEQLGVTLHFTASEANENEGFPAFASVSISDWLGNPNLQEEVFGPYTLLVIYHSTDDLKEAVFALKGQLTCTLLAEATELNKEEKIIHSIREVCGRLLFGGMPTGVEVCPSMTHGGPFPASSNSQSTSVGTSAIKRFVRPVSFQSFPDEFLPVELQNKNILGIWRTINGELSKSDINYGA